MKRLIILLGLMTVIVISGCVGQNLTPTTKVSGTQELLLNAQDLQQLGMTSAMSYNGTDCQTEEQTSIYSSTVQYSICNYTINSLNDTWVVVELNKFANYEELNGTFEYESQHLFSVQGIISVNDYGDQSLFRVNNVNDYMGQLNNPNVYNYHLWICKDLFLIHITSRGSSKDAKEYIPKIGRQILSKFG
jgi:hypothetical protein